MNNVLEIEGLKKSFGPKQVLNGLNLTVPSGSVFGFIGKNGAGKTTTMKTVVGLMEQDEGTVKVCGEKVHFGQTPTNRYIGYLPDVPEFYNFMTPYEYLVFCGEITNMEKSAASKRADELLDLVGLDKDAKRRIKGFSRGMKQRLGIAQALLNSPKLLICDEPTSALDPVGRKEVLDILTGVKNQTTVLFSTHILSDVERICTDIAFLNDGAVCLDGKLADIKSAYRKDEYVIETEDNMSAALLIKAFPELIAFGEDEPKNVLNFRGDAETFYRIIGFISDNKVGVAKIEKQEPSLESLFMEVVSK